MRMFDRYTAALTAYYKSEGVLRTGIALVDSRYLEARRVRKRAIEVLLRARRLYLNHVTEHKCRPSAFLADLGYETNRGPGISIPIGKIKT